MEDRFIKKYWDEGQITFYIHFSDGYAARQINVTPSGVYKMDVNNFVNGEFILADKKLEETEFSEEDFITKDQFEEAWKFYEAQR